ncbi:MAG: LodA/GoxA family CTQ-dependent oxidase [Actinomycetota bacterium]
MGNASTTKDQITDLLSRRSFLERAAVVAAAAAVPGLSAAPASAATLRRVARVAIHPAVAVARVGNSRDAFFFAPEIPSATPIGPFKDAKGAMAKQAARFRLYGYDSDGKVICEITSAEADVSWSATVGNGKAAWYCTDIPLDVAGANPVARRNADVADRASIYPISHSRIVRGPGAAPARLNGGLFAGVPVDFGEILTDGKGRLIVMPGVGRAYSAPDAPPLAGYGDNDGWIDDTCDGPITATIRINGKTLRAAPARVICASPNFAPGIGSGLITLHDAALSGLVSAGRRRRGPTDFTRDVLPIFTRMSDMQWVNEGYLSKYGFGSDADWSSPAMGRRLADASPANRAFRKATLARFRDPTYKKVQPDLEPQFYGDQVMMPPNLTSARQWYALTTLQYAHLKVWSGGDFSVSRETAPSKISDLPISKQPTTLDRAALDGCLGGAFHPGVEFPWIARVNWIWTDDLRLRFTKTQRDLTDYGANLTRAVAMSRSGPLSRLGPGGAIGFMGVPWHADSSSCRYGYQSSSPQLPGFWPARIPNAVLSTADYKVVVNTKRPLAQRRAAFNRRHEWERFIAQPTGPPTLALMVDEWFKLGVVRERPGPRDGAFPTTLKVESDVGFTKEPTVIYPASASIPQLPAFPIITANSNDNSLRSISEKGRVTVLGLKGGIARPEGLTRDRYGNLYAAAMDGGSVQKITPDLRVSTYVSGLTNPVGLAMTFGGTLFITSYVPGGLLTVVEPTGEASTFVAAGAGLDSPVSVTIAPDKSCLLVSNFTNATVSRVDATTGEVLDPAWISGVKAPAGIAFDPYWNLYLAANGDSTIRRFTIGGKSLPFKLRGQRLNPNPFGLAFDSAGRLYVASAKATTIQRITIDGSVGTVETFATRQSNPGGIVFNG